MPRAKTSIPIFTILVLVIHAVQTAVKQIKLATALDSPGGRKITLAEAGQIAAAISAQVHEDLVKHLPGKDLEDV